MKNHKYLFVVNPKSGKGKALKLIKKLLDVVKDKLIFDVYLTKPNHYATELKHLINKEKYTHVLSVGGDGTANEVLNAVVGTDATLGIFPFGSGNDFARNMNIPNKINKLLEMIHNNKTEKIDCGKAGDSYFLNYISFGLDSEINRKAEIYKTSMPGASSYLIAVFHALIRHKSKQVIINGEDKNIHLVAIHNGRYYGGGIPMNPTANVKDGELNLIYVDKMWKSRVLMIFPTIFMGLHHKFKQVHFSKIKDMILDSKDSILTTLDGEEYTLNFPLNIEVQPNALNFLRY